jgi:glycosyltransferase involved in cell wall biosynthesis
MTKIDVAIASANRPAVLHDTVLELFNQSRPPDEIIVVYPESSSEMTEEHVSARTRKLPVRLFAGPRGCSHQRNTAIDLTDSDVLLFLDDDVQLDSRYIEQCLRILAENSDAAGVSGWVVVDGTVESNEIAREDAKDVLQRVPPQAAPLRDTGSFYGCNMVVRTSIAKLVRFDENLRGYSIFEDRDFGNRVRRYGRILYSKDCRLVHLATRSGRVNAVNFGAAQIRTPIYCWRKGSFTSAETLELIRNSVGRNLLGLIKPNKGKNRRVRIGQLAGNLKGAMLSLMESARALASSR